MDKTVTVLVERQEQHALYGKYCAVRASCTRTTKSACDEGDLVRIAECRPLSKTKHCRVVEVVARAAE